MAALSSQILGRWETVSSENVDEYLQAIGCGTVKRTLASNLQPTLIFSERDGKITLRFTTPLISSEYTFELGTAFDQSMALEPHIKSRNVFTLEGNKLIQNMTMLNNGVEALVVREFNGDEMLATATAGAVVSTIRYKRVS